MLINERKQITMKKSISVLLCLVMLFSIFSVCTVAANTVDANNMLYVKSNGFENGQITYTVYLRKNVSVNGVVLKIKYDPTVVQPVMTWSSSDNGKILENNGAYTTKDSDGDTVYPVPGEYVSGAVTGSNNAFSIGYMNMTGYKNGSSDKAFMTFKLKAVSSEYPVTDVEFYCVEFDSSDSSFRIPKSETNPQKFYTHTTPTLNKTVHTSVASTQNGLKVSWNATPGATYYKVYKMVNSQPILLDGNVTDTSYNDTTAVQNQVTKYTVRAYNSYGVDSGYAGTISGVFVKAPATLTAVNAATGVKLTWSAVSGAQNYRLYRRTVNSDGSKSSWTSLNTFSSSQTSYTDTVSLSSGKHYQYTVITYALQGWSGVYTYADVYYYAAPTVTLASVDGGAKISWNAVAGAEKYRVYRRYSGVKDYTLIAVVDKSQLSYIDSAAVSGKTITYTVRAFTSVGISAFVTKNINYVQTPKLVDISNSTAGIYLKWNAVSGAKNYRVYRKTASASTWTYLATTTQNYYTDKSAKDAYRYNYTVRAVGSVYSGYNTSGLTIKRLTTPKLVSVSNLNGGVYVKWNTVSGAAGYYVYRKTGSGSWSKIATVSGGSKVTYTDATAKSGTNYTYTVRAYNGNYISYFDTAGLTVKRLTTPKLVSVSKASSGVYFKWNAVSGASGYYVYRKTGNGGWSKIATVSGASKVAYTDKTAKAGTTYTYTVRAYNGKYISYYNTTGLKIKR